MRKKISLIVFRIVLQKKPRKQEKIDSINNKLINKLSEQIISNKISKIKEVVIEAVITVEADIKETEADMEVDNTEITIITIIITIMTIKEDMVVEVIINKINNIMEVDIIIITIITRIITTINNKEEGIKITEEEAEVNTEKIIITENVKVLK